MRCRRKRGGQGAGLHFFGFLRIWTLSSGDSWPAIWQLVGVVKPAMQGDQPNPVCKVWPATLATDCTWTTLTIGAATLGTMPSPRTYRTQRGARRAFRSFQDDCAGAGLARRGFPKGPDFCSGFRGGAGVKPRRRFSTSPLLSLLSPCPSPEQVLARRPLASSATLCTTGQKRLLSTVWAVARPPRR